mgnify:CR=1 FL=1
MKIKTKKNRNNVVPTVRGVQKCSLGTRTHYLFLFLFLVFKLIYLIFFVYYLRASIYLSGYSVLVYFYIFIFLYFSPCTLSYF